MPITTDTEDRAVALGYAGVLRKLSEEERIMMWLHGSYPERGDAAFIARMNMPIGGASVAGQLFQHLQSHFVRQPLLRDIMRAISDLKDESVISNKSQEEGVKLFREHTEEFVRTAFHDHGEGARPYDPSLAFLHAFVLKYRPDLQPPAPPTAPLLTLPPGVPAKDLDALSLYIRNNLDAGRYGLPDVFDAEKLGVDPKAYAKHAREVWWPALLSRFKGHARDRDIEAVVHDYQMLSMIYGNVLAYTGTSAHDIHHPEVEYKQAMRDAARSTAPWWSADFDAFGYPLADPKGTAQRLLEEAVKSTSNSGWSSYVELARPGLPPMKVFARIWAYVKIVDGYPRTALNITTYLYVESMDFVTPNTIRPDLQHVQDRHNDGPNAYFVGGAPAYALPVISVLAPALAIDLVNRNTYASDVVNILKKRGWTEAKTGKPKDGRKTYKRAAPGHGSLLAWVSSEDDEGFHVLNPPTLETTKGKTK